MLWTMQCRAEASKTDATLLINVLISSSFDRIEDITEFGLFFLWNTDNA